MQQIAHRAVRGQPADALLASHINGELDGVAVVGVEHVVAADQPCAFQCHQAMTGHRDDVVDQGADLRFDVDRGDRHRRVLGQAQRLVGAQHVPQPETGDAAQHHAGREFPGVEQVQHRVGQKPGPPDVIGDHALSFTEVGGQLQAWLVHS